MTLKHALAVAAILIAVSGPGTAADSGAAVSRPGAMPVVAEHHYRMLAKVRPLLFWISRDDVGSARIGWLSDNTGARGFELLIGSDPTRAPRKINRWGYIAEEQRGTHASTIGLMKHTNEDSIEQAKAGLSREAASGTHAFKAIKAVSADGRARSDVLTVQAAGDLTYRDVGSLLTLVTSSAGARTTRTVGLPSGTRPGFLIALADLISNPAMKSVPYVYNGRFHTLRLHATETASMQIGNRKYTNLVRAKFETENNTTHERTPFVITYGTTGALKEVPVHVVYQPKWWFQVELFLDDDASRF